MQTPELKDTKADRAVRKTGRATSAKYRPTNMLDIPAPMEKAFAAMGYKLYWVRILDPKTRQVDNAAVSRVLDIGGGLVTPEEARMIDVSFLSNKTRLDYADEFGLGAERAEQKGLKVNDVVLVKVPLEYVQSKAEYLANASKDRVRSAFSNMRKESGGNYNFKSTTGGSFSSSGDEN